MKNAYSYYRRKSAAITKHVLAKKSSSARIFLALYTVSSFIGKLIFFLRPVFQVADQNIAKMIVEAQALTFEKAFEGVGSKYGKLLLANIVVDLQCLGVLVAFGVPTFLVYFSLLGSVPAAAYSIAAVLELIALLLLVHIQLIYAPKSYVSASGANLDCGDLLLNAKLGSKGMKLPLFIAYCLKLLLPLLVCGGIFAGVYFSHSPLYNALMNAMRNKVGVSLIVTFYDLIMWSLLVLIYLLVFSPFVFKKNVQIYLMEQDAIDPKHIVLVKQVAGANAKYSPIFAEQDKNVLGKEEKK